MFRRFGSEVTIIEMGPRLVQREDEEISAAIQEILSGEGINLRLNAEMHSASAGARAILPLMSIATPAARRSMGTHLLLAVGRQPNTDDLGLEAAGVSRDKRGYIVVNDRLRDQRAGHLGPGRLQRERRVHPHLLQRLRDRRVEPARRRSRGVSDRITAYALYIDPPLGRAGMTETEARRQWTRGAGRQTAHDARRPRDRERRDQRLDENRRRRENRRRFSAPPMFGTGGDEAIHCVLDTMYAKAPYTVLQRAMHIHPTVSELIPTLLGELA